MKSSVTVVIPCYNSGVDLLRATDSILRQSKMAHEIIVVNDASTDLETIALLHDLHHPKVRVIHHKTNLGLPQARNTGFRSASGDFVLFLDADDSFEASAIEEMLRAVPNNEENFFIFTDLTFCGARVGNSERIYLPFSQLMVNRIPYSILIPRNSINWGKPYCSHFRWGLEDWDFNLSLLERNFKPIRVAMPLFNYYVSENGMFKTQTEPRFFSIFNEIVRRHSTLYSKENLFRLFKLQRKMYTRKFPLLPILLIIVSRLPFPKLINYLFVLSRRVVS